jgi:predicted ATPase
MAQLTGIILENFKAFKNRQVIPIRPLTLIYGPNSAGKSSITHALAFLQYAFENAGQCNPQAQCVGWETFNLDGWNNLVFNHDVDATVKIGLQFSNGSALWGFAQNSNGPFLSYFTAKFDVINEDDAFDGTEKQSAKELGVSVKCENGRIHLSANHPVIRNASKIIWQFICTGRSWESPDSANVIPVISYEILEAILEQYLETSPPIFEAASFFPSYKPVNEKSDLFEICNSPFSDITIKESRFAIYKKLSEGFTPKDVLNGFFDKLDWGILLTDNTFENAHREIEKILGRRIHLGPARTPPGREINTASAPHEPWRIVLENELVRNSVNTSLRDLNIPYQLEVAWKRETYFKPGIDPKSTHPNLHSEDRIERTQDSKSLSFVNNSGLSLAHSDLGYGISTTLPILVAIHTSHGNCISIEQPELHIHPRLQTVLGDMFIKASLAGSDEEDFLDDDHLYRDPLANNLLLIETHSEHLLLRILRRIRESKLSNKSGWPKNLKDACPNGIERNGVVVLYVEPGAEGSIIRELRINDIGEFLDSWPGGFFEESFDEMF